jgi:ribosomal protein L11 methyltransferase
MDYMEVSFEIQPRSTGTEILIAMLSQIGYESFLETEEFLKAYIPASDFELTELYNLQKLLSTDYELSFTYQLVKSQNWNEVWESNFNPVLIGDSVFVRAPFHNSINSVKYEIVIEPKMSFGTAHHETTSMMIELMMEENFSGSSVLDMGCGTGILAILAEMLGARSIIAIDNDEWAYENALENIRKNKCSKINVFKGNAGLLGREKFGIILANINRNVLVEDMQIYSEHLNSNGAVIMSGFYSEDIQIIEHAATGYGLTLNKKISKNDWVAARFTKNPPENYNG